MLSDRYITVYRSQKAYTEIHSNFLNRFLYLSPKGRIPGLACIAMDDYPHNPSGNMIPPFSPLISSLLYCQILLTYTVWAQTICMILQPDFSFLFYLGRKYKGNRNHYWRWKGDCQSPSWFRHKQIPIQFNRKYGHQTNDLTHQNLPHKRCWIEGEREQRDWCLDSSRPEKRVVIRFIHMRTLSSQQQIEQKPNSINFYNYAF